MKPGKREARTETPDTVWQERRDFFPGDTQLRKFGFVIAYRRNGEQPIWMRNGRLYPQSKARELVMSEMRATQRE